MRRHLPFGLLLLLVACGSEKAGTTDAGDGAARVDGTKPDATASPTDSGIPAVDGGPGLSLPTTPGTYTGTCDGSGGVAIDFTHFLDLNDEHQGVRIYTRGANGLPVQEVDISAGLGMAPTDEADLEDAARLGNRVYGIASHGRNKNGVFAPNRYRFFAMDLSGAVPALNVIVAGSSSGLLANLLDASRWVTPNAGVIATLTASSELGTATNASLAPEKNGTYIEGLAVYPSSTNPGRLAIGFRNPQSGTRALVVTLLNADAVIGGAPARFGEAILLDLGGLGIRSMAWSEAHHAMLVLAGPSGGVGTFALYTWSGDATAAPSRVRDISPPTDGSPEAIVTYPGTKDVQILFDMGDAQVGGVPCKDAADASKRFTDVIVHVD